MGRFSTYYRTGVLMAAPTVKLTLQNANFTSYASDASGMLTYYADFGNATHNPNDYTVLIQAMAGLPCGPIGTRLSVQVPGGPTGLNNGLLAYHVPRVYSISPRVVQEKNSNKIYVDVVFKSRPRPTYEMGSGTSQVSTSTYLSSPDQSLVQNISFSQMVLEWLEKAGVYGITPDGTQNPPAAIQWPKEPFTGQKFQFGATFRLGATFYSDELTLSQSSILEANYVNSINLRSTGIFNTPQAPYDDRRKWLVTSFNLISDDGGFTNRASVEMVFNPFGWDSLGIFTVPFSNSKAILDTAVLNQLNQMLGSDNTSLAVPPPYVPVGGGAGRWPQQIAVNTNALLGFLCQGTGNFTTYTLAQALNPLTTF